jgi:hypothetical protein
MTRETHAAQSAVPRWFGWWHGDGGGPHPRARGATRRAAALAGVTALALALVPLLLGRSYFGMDLTYMELGLLCDLRAAWSAGEVGLSSMLGNGEPRLANAQAQLFYPVRWLVLAFPPDTALNLGVAVHLAVAAAGAAWLVRTHGVGVQASACAGVAYAACGTVACQVGHATYIVGAAWLPVMWAEARCATRFRAGGGAPVALALSAAACLLGGEPQSFVVAGGVVGVECLRCLARRRGRALASVGRVALALAAALALAMPQWLPAWREMALTHRAQGFRAAEALKWSFTSAEWLGALAPGILRQPLQGETTWWKLLADGGPSMAWNSSTYLGPLLLVVSWLGITQRRTRVAAVVYLGALVLAVGDALPVLPWLLDAVPPVSVFRYPAKFLVVASLAAVVVAVVTLSRWGRTAGGRGLLRTGGVALLAGMGAVGAVAWAAADVLDGLPLGSAPDADLPTVSRALVVAVGTGAAPLAIAVGVCWRSARWARWTPLLAALDVLLAAPLAVDVGPPLATRASPLRALAQPPGQAVLCHHADLLSHQFHVPGDYSAWPQAHWARFVAYPTLHACDGLVSGLSYSSLQTAVNRTLAAAVSADWAWAARALGCTHLVTGRPPRDGTVHRLWPGQAGGSGGDVAQAVNLFGVEDPVPPAFVSRAPRLLVGEGEVVAALEAGRESPALLAVVDDPLGRLGDTSLPDGAGVVDVRVEWAGRSRPTLTATGHGGGVLGITSSFQVGWRARQAGQQLPVVRAAGSHVAVVVADVAAGPVELAYQPPGLEDGILLALLGVAVLAALAWSGRRRPP